MDTDDEIINRVNSLKNTILYYAQIDDLDHFKRYVELIQFEGKELKHLVAGPKVLKYISDKIKFETGTERLFSQMSY